MQMRNSHFRHAGFHHGYFIIMDIHHGTFIMDMYDGIANSTVVPVVINSTLYLPYLTFATYLCLPSYLTLPDIKRMIASDLMHFYLHPVPCSAGRCCHVIITYLSPEIPTYLTYSPVLSSPTSIALLSLLGLPDWSPQSFHLLNPNYVPVDWTEPP